MELQANLKALNLSHMARQVEGALRQARQSGIGYEEFLIELTCAELQARANSRLERRMREAKFPLVKTLEMFDPAAAPELDIRLLRDLRQGDIFRREGTSFSWDEVALVRLTWSLRWGSRPARTTSVAAL